MKVRNLLLSVLLCFPFLQASSQVSIKDSSIFTTMFYATYSYQFPGGDLVKRFGNNSNIGGGVMFKTRGNWLFGVEGDYLFGNKVKNKNAIFSNISTTNGYLIGKNGSPANISFGESGMWATLKLGKVIPCFGSNPNSGIMIVASGGYMQNKIRIDVKDNNVAQLTDSYKKGYDRLSGGMGVSGFLGYLYMGNRKIMTFFGGVEFTQAWTKSYRKYNYDEMKPDLAKRIDNLVGIKFGWIIPIYKAAPAKYYYY